MIKLTFIVCVYNSASTIIRTLESIYRQPIVEEEFEVIVVDDCSPDNSSELVTNFAIGHTNLHLVRQKENHRVGTSMNIGIRMAKGEYIQVVDGDDVVGDGIIDTLNQCMKDGVDVSINASQFEAEDGSLYPMTISTNLEFPMSSNEFCEKVFTCDPIFGGTQFYMWRREFLLRVDHPFVEELKMEDTDWIEYHLPLAKNIGCSGHITYCYLYNVNSQVHNPSISTLTDFVLQSYRRLLVSQLYKTQQPKYAERIKEASIRRVSSLLRYKHLTKFANKDYAFIYRRIGFDVRKGLSEYSFPAFTNLCLMYKYLTLFVLYGTSWIVRLGRNITRLAKKVQS